MDNTSETAKLFGIVAIITAVMVGGILLAARNQPQTNASQVTGTLPDVTDSDWSRGSKDAPNVVVEYADFQCPACAQVELDLEKLIVEHNDKVRIVFRHFPLPQHANELPMAYAAEAAGKQGKFWEMHDMIYAKQAGWSTATDAVSIAKGYAQSLGLDMTRYSSDVSDQSIVDRVNQGREQSRNLKLPGTPSFFLNGKSIQTPASYDDWLTVLNVK